MDSDKDDLVASNSDEEPEIPSILDSLSPEQIEEFRPFHERYFKKMYCTKFSTDSLYLSEKHSILQNQQTIKHINFQVSKKVNRLKNSMTGKGKRGAQLLQPDSVLCFIETTAGVQYPVHAGVWGKLLEINARVIQKPNYLTEDLNEGFLAVILPDLKRHEANMQSLLSVDDYK